MKLQAESEEFQIDCSIRAFVVRLMSVLEEGEVFFRFNNSESYWAVHLVETDSMGIWLHLRGINPFFLLVEQIEPDMFVTGEGESVIPDWMTA